MKKGTRIILTTAAAFLLLVAAIAAGLNAIFTVTLVSTEFEVYSEAGAEEASLLKQELDKFTGKSTTLLDLDDVKETVNRHVRPSFRVEVRKDYPKTLTVKVTERRETFAVANGSGVSVYDEEGKYLYESEENVNLSGGTNIMLEGFSFTADAEGKFDGAYADSLYRMFAVFSEQMQSVRANVTAVRLVREGSDHPRNYRFVVSMREGVKLVIFTPSEGIETKARSVLLDEENGYLSPAFPYGKRLYGAISASDLGEDGQVTVGFSSVVPVAGI